MARLLLLTIASLGIALAGSAGDGKPDFSGNWTLNLDRSTFGKAAKPTALTLKVTRDGDVMHSVQTNGSQVDSKETESDWIVDGKEHDSPGPAPAKVTTKWEGSTLYSEHKSNDGSYTQKIWLSLSSDGKTATEKVWTKGPDGINLSNLIWQRQP